MMAMGCGPAIWGRRVGWSIMTCGLDHIILRDIMVFGIMPKSIWSFYCLKQ